MANITLTLGNITNNGVPCKDPIIVLTGYSDTFTFPCGDKIDEDGNIKLSIDDSVFDGLDCIQGVIQCSSCSACTKEFELCLCDENTDCKHCQKCVGGVCIDICPDKKCLNNTCVDCIDVADCPVGFQCINGLCVCNGIVDDYGNCVDCLTSSDCSTCESCQDGGCIPLDCPSNLICTGNGCGCPPGSHYEVATNSCVPNDECTSDEDCTSTCETCVSGICQPVICPEGYTCQDGDCVYDPCPDTPCETGLDCGPECGCSEEKLCKPCSELTCDECGTVYGCECINGNCQKVVDCGGVCSTGEDCPDGCGCYQGECVDCDNFTPEQQANIPGCNNKACTDKFESKIEGCKLVTTLTSTEPCACPVITTALKNGVAIPTVKTKAIPRGTVIEWVDIKSDLNFELRKGIAADYSGFLYLPKLDDISHPSIAHNEEASSGTVTLDLQLTYRTETAVGVLGDPTVINLPPITTSLVDRTSVSFNGVSFRTVELVEEAENANQRGLYKFVTNIKVKISHTNLVFPNTCNYGSKILFEKDYVANTNIVGPSTLSSFYDTLISLDKLQAAGSKLPMFTYYRSKDTEYTTNEIFRKVYVPKSGLTYTDILYGPGCVSDPGKYPLVTPEFGLYSGYNYLIKNDCGGCSQAKQVAIEPLVICETTEPSVVVTNCGRRLQINNLVANCPINKDLAVLLGTTCPYPIDAQVYFNVYVNGVLKASLKASEALDVTYEEGITSIRIEHSHDPSCVYFEETYAVTDKDANYTTGCNTNGTFSVIFSENVGGGVTIVSVKDVTPNGNPVTKYPVSGSITFNNLATNNGGSLSELQNTYKFEIVFSDGCSQNKVITVNCCSSSSITAAADYTVICDLNGQPTLTVTPTGSFTLPYVMYFRKDGVTNPDATGWSSEQGSPQVNNISLPFSIQVQEPGDWVFKIVDAAGCIKVSNVLTITECTHTNFKVTPDITCSDASSLLEVNGEPNNTYTLVYPNLSTTSITLDANGYWSQNVTQAGEYSLQGTGLDATLTVVPTPELTGITAPSSACEDVPVSFLFSGTPQSIITVDFGTGAPITLTLSNGGTVTYNYTYQDPGSFTVQVTGISLGDTCTSVPTITHTINILQKPIITVGATNCDLANGTAATAVTVIPASSVVGTNVGSFSGVAPNLVLNTGITANVIITASNGACISTQNVAINCSCPDIISNTWFQGEVCVSGGNASFISGEELEVTLLYNLPLGSSAVATYNSIDYPMNISGLVATLPLLPLGWTASNPDIVVTVQDSATLCTDNITLTPTDIQAPVANINGPSTLCAGSVANFSSVVSGSMVGYTYQWTVLQNGSNLTLPNINNSTFSFTPSTTGALYEIQLNLINTGNGCNGTSNVISLAATTCCPTITVGIVGTINSCSDITLTATGGTAPYTYGVIPSGSLTVNSVTGGNVIDINGEVYGTSGTYTVTATDSNGCTGQTVIPFTKCSCICNGSNCVTTYTQFGTNGFGTILETDQYPAGKQLRIKTHTAASQSTLSDRFRVYVHNGMSSTLLVDTGYTFIVNNGGCPITNGLPIVDFAPFNNGDDVTAEIPVALTTVTLVTKALSELSFEYTTAGGDWIEIVHNDATCATQGQWNYNVTCLN